ncbi:alpha/beta hydrolase family protein [Phenylobacterium sp.]|uniref:alpha/beta hydrolase family protein n=1 Tax=Phenylobacterium sp. TaxID=1871053 RepID=UPI002FE19BC8
MTTGVTRWVLGLAAALAAMVLMLAQAARAQEAAGEWHGVLSAMGAELRIGVVIETGPDGLTGHLTSPDQGPMKLPLAEVRMQGGRLAFKVPSVRGRYEGAWDVARGAWSGTWTQVQPLPLVLRKGPVPAAVRNRPQVPAKPYPYREEEVAFDSLGGARLAGTLTLPQGPGPFPAAVLISGSGPQDRDETLAGHKPFLVLADHLTRQGVAVLRYDDRGFAKSTGDLATAAAAEFVADAEAAVAFLRGRAEIAPDRIGLVGHSEGGVVAPLVAGKDPRIAYVVMLAGPGVPLGELLAAQRKAVYGVGGAPPERVERAQAVLARADAAVLAASDFQTVKREVAALLTAELGAPPEAAAMQAGLMATPWYRWIIGYDPRPALSRVRQPVLAVNGEKDLQVLPGQNLPAIREALKGNPDVTVLEFPGLNHLFQTAATGSPTEYARIEETFAPAALKVVGDWIVARAGPRASR